MVCNSLGDLSGHCSSAVFIDTSHTEPAMAAMARASFKGREPAPASLLLKTGADGLLLDVIME